VLRTALFSPCGRFRYLLSRRWDTGRGTVLWIMLNPSTADAERDDPTIRRCIGFSRLWGFGAMEAVNLFALRATDPRELGRADDPVGPLNDRHIADAAAGAAAVIAAWGAHPLAASRTGEVRPLLPGSVRCLGRTASGAPRHPLYTPSHARRIAFRGPTVTSV